ncbi:transposase, partial [uncultured Jannaschia sp.]|uniref:IS110 family transposase n=1 Tax=uncultured Jannaschia sp. TaxID=293347 RepID=UPI00343DB0F0
MTMQDTIGVDVSKDCLDACHAGASDHRAFSNDTSGLTALCRWVRERGDVLVVFEASGAYHRDLEQALARRGLPFAKVNPRQARRFAEAIGQVAKTDRVDAAILARMGVALQLEPTSALPEHMSELQDLLVYRRGLVKDRT